MQQVQKQTWGPRSATACRNCIEFGVDEADGRLKKSPPVPGPCEAF